jgi:hypothetical protein
MIVFMRSCVIKWNTCDAPVLLHYGQVEFISRQAGSFMVGQFGDLTVYQLPKLLVPMTKSKMLVIIGRCVRGTGWSL